MYVEMPGLGLYQRLLAAARRHPRRVVLVDSRSLLSYQDLSDAIDARAAALLELCRSGDRVGVLLSPSATTVVTYYACLRAGVVYTPLADYPDAVVTDLVERLELAALVTERGIDVAVPKLSVDEAAARPAAFPAVDPSAPAHLLLTSGSTGVPKAVLTDQIGSMLCHDWRAGLCPFEADDVVGCNVFGIWDVVPALEHGVAVVMIDDATLRDPRALAGTIVRHRITRLMLTPSLLGACLAAPAALAGLKRLRLIVLCGEIAKPAVLRRARACLPHTRLLNLYSIAECHDVAAGFVREGESWLQRAPFADVRVVDPDDLARPVEVGEVGRILVGGPGVARGYAGHPSGAFFERGGRRFYDTGDLGLLNAAGRLSIVGRADARTKVRGRWVDPTELEHAMTSHPDVVDASVVVAHGRVLARVVGHGADLAERLRAHVQEALPGHVVPDRIDVVDSLDVAPSGKAQRHPARRRAASLEATVVDVFRDVLNDLSIGPGDHFSDIGGTSLDAIMLCGRLEAVTGRPVSIADLHRHDQPRRLAALIERAESLAENAWNPAVDLPPIARPPTIEPFLRAFVTGAAGHLGVAVVAALGDRGVPLTRPQMDLEQPFLGLPTWAFDALAREIDGVIHTAARVDPFGDFTSLYRINVGGTLELIRLAGLRGVPFHHVSSSSVFPLGTHNVWTSDVEPSTALADLLRDSGADAYSSTKLAAEIALWRAAEEGLPVRIVRLPHVLGHPHRDRLQKTLAAMRAAGVYPEGDWQWQFVTRERAVEALIEPLDRPAQIRHVALPPVAVSDLVSYLGLDLRPVPMAAIATALDRVEPAHPHYVDARVLRQLVTEHGPAAALSMSDPILSARGGDSLGAFAAAFARFTSD